MNEHKLLKYYYLAKLTEFNLQYILELMAEDYKDIRLNIQEIYDRNYKIISNMKEDKDEDGKRISDLFLTGCCEIANYYELCKSNRDEDLISFNNTTINNNTNISQEPKRMIFTKEDFEKMLKEDDQWD